MKKMTKIITIFVFTAVFMAGCKDKSKSAGADVHGTLTFIRGSVLLNQTPAVIGAKVNMSDSIEVKDKSTAVVQFSTNAMITIESNSNLVIKSLLQGKDGVTSIALDQSRGSTFNKIVPGKANYSVNTPTITAGVRGTAFRVNSGNQGTQIELYNGKVALTKDSENKAGSKEPAKELILEAGQKVTVTETEIQAPVKMKEAEIKDLERLNNIAMLPEKKLGKIETLNSVSDEEAKEIQKDASAQVVPEESQKILQKMEEAAEDAPEITLADIKKQYGSLSKVTTKNGKTFVGAFKQVGGKFEIITVTGKEVVSATDIAKVQQLE
ncbi:MAG: FecR domain-containing protein [Spirochaetia bacterium]|nr:FecR domain-containing protein [Spirochaetia bacterium]